MHQRSTTFDTTESKNAFRRLRKSLLLPSSSVGLFRHTWLSEDVQMVSASRYDSRNLRRWFLALHGTEYRPCPRQMPRQASDGTYENNRPAVPQSRQWRNEWKLAVVVPCSEHPLYRMQVDIMQRCIDTWEGCTEYFVTSVSFVSFPSEK